MQVLPEYTNLPTCIYIYIYTHLSLGGAYTTSNNKPFSLEKQGNERRKDFFLLLSTIRSRSIISTLFLFLLVVFRKERALLTETGKWDDRTFISSFIHLQSIFNKRKSRKKEKNNVLVCAMKKKRNLVLILNRIVCLLERLQWIIKSKKKMHFFLHASPSSSSLLWSLPLFYSFKYMIENEWLAIQG